MIINPLENLNFSFGKILTVMKFLQENAVIEEQISIGTVYVHISLKTRCPKENQFLQRNYFTNVHVSNEVDEVIFPEIIVVKYYTCHYIPRLF